MAGSTRCDGPNSFVHVPRTEGGLVKEEKQPRREATPLQIHVVLAPGAHAIHPLGPPGFVLPKGAREEREAGEETQDAVDGDRGVGVLDGEAGRDLGGREPTGALGQELEDAELDDALQDQGNGRHHGLSVSEQELLIFLSGGDY